MNKICILFLAVFSFSANAQPVIVTIAGTGTSGFSGDGGLATAAKIYAPAGMAIDTAGNFIFSDRGNNRIRKISASGVITTICGTGYYGIIGEGGPAISAAIEDPSAILLDDTGNIFISSGTGVRKISKTTGNINTYFTTYYFSRGMAMDDTGNVYIADFNSIVYKISRTGTATVYAGTGTQGYSGDGGLATAAEFNYPLGLAWDTSGLYIVDAANNMVRKVLPSGVVIGVAGNGVAGFAGDGGLATAAELDNPGYVTVDKSGSVYVSDRANARVRKITTAGVISTIAGNGGFTFSGDNVNPTSTAVSPDQMVFDVSGNMYISDGWNQRIRVINFCSIHHILSNPRDTTVNAGTSTFFSINDDQTAGGTYQWQVDTGTGFRSITSSLTYLGITTAHLTINTTPAKLNNSKYRCIRSTKYCADTSASATLSVVGLGVETITRNFSIKPNPASNTIIIEALQKIYSVEIINSLGQLILSKQYNSEKVSIDIQPLPQGNYFLRINNQYTQKFVKE